VFAGNGFRCPLTELAERYGAQSGSVTDIYLPKRVAHNMPAIHTAACPHDVPACTESAAVTAHSQWRLTPATRSTVKPASRPN
jgi:hypothetical protein